MTSIKDSKFYLFAKNNKYIYNIYHTTKTMFLFIIWNIKGFFFYITASPSTEPWMTDGEKKLFYESLQDTRVLLEFGSGGSTIYALKNRIKVFSIESSRWFMMVMKKSTIIKDAQKNNDLYYYYANIGTTGEWGYPLSKHVNGKIYWHDPIKNIPSYLSSYMYKNWDKIDTVFIDGRYRVSCALNILINFPNIKKIIIHDYISRKEYHILEQFFHREATSGTLVIFSPRCDISHRKITESIEKYKDDYR